jgi:3',5'-cyclic AMP phosphodiesterase CpdA
MKKLNLLICIVIALVFLTAGVSCKQATQPAANGDFTFVFMTDIHLKPECNAEAGFQKAIDKINELGPDFVITGGDLIMDALAQSYGRADTLYNLYKKMITGINVPVYNTMGNHEIWGISKNSNADRNNPEFGEKMFEKRIGPRFYSFLHKGWKFMILDGTDEAPDGGYIGQVDSIQMQWIKSELEKTDTLTPIIISIHIPLMTVYNQVMDGSTVANEKWGVVINSREVLALFSDYNLKLVLQGHQHYIEEIYVGGVRFLTGGAVSARWWKGPLDGMEEGFMLIRVKNGEASWEYIDYGWEAKVKDQ